MLQNEYDDFQRIVREHVTAYGKPAPDTDAMAGWWKSLKRRSLGEVQRALDELAARAGAKYPATPGEVVGVLGHNRDASAAQGPTQCGYTHDNRRCPFVGRYESDIGRLCPAHHEARGNARLSFDILELADRNEYQVPPQPNDRTMIARMIACGQDVSGSYRSSDIAWVRARPDLIEAQTIAAMASEPTR